MTDIFCPKCGRVPDSVNVFYNIRTTVKPTATFKDMTVEGLLEMFDEYRQEGWEIEYDMSIVRKVVCGECEHYIYEE